MIKQGDDYTVTMVDLPVTVQAMVCYDESDFPNIYINSRLDHETQARALMHELGHIVMDDIHSNRPTRQIEAG